MQGRWKPVEVGQAMKNIYFIKSRFNSRNTQATHNISLFDPSDQDSYS